MPGELPEVHATELADLTTLRPHPQNYRGHPQDQRRHLQQSFAEHGFYRNIVVARDGTILAGHGVVEAARESGLTEVPVVRLPIEPDDPKALKLLVGDNENPRLAETNDRLLAELLREVRDTDLDGLLGTGYDDQMLANLVFVTRGEQEIADRHDADSWVGLPEFDGVEQPYRVVVSCDTEEDRDALLATLGIERTHKRIRGVWTVWWPARPREDLNSLRFEAAEDAA